MPKKTFEAAALADAHLIVQLKDNQPILCQKVEAVCAAAEPLSSLQTVDEKRRNRHETRVIAVFDAAPAVTGTEWAPHVSAIIKVEREVNTRQAATGLWKPSSEISFYLSSRPVAAIVAADAVRKHWGIENKSHYTRDVTFREDASRIRTNPGVVARLRSLAYNIPALQPIRHYPSRPLRPSPRRPQIGVLNDAQQRALNSPVFDPCAREPRERPHP